MYTNKTGIMVPSTIPLKVDILKKPRYAVFTRILEDGNFQVLCI